MSAPRSPRERVYRTALLVLPRAFRERFEDEMVDFARARVREARRRGRVDATREIARLATDLCVSAPSAWMHQFTAVDVPPSHRRTHRVEVVIQDLRFAARSLARRPAFTLVAGAILALGIGANTAIFSVVDAVLIRPLPYPHADRLTILSGTERTHRREEVSYADYLDWRRLNGSFEDMGVERFQSVNLTGGTTPEHLFASFVSASWLRLMGERMSMGRGFTDAETELGATDPVAILSYETWRAHFGADPAVLNTTVLINGTAFTVVGITAPNMGLPHSRSDVLLPVSYVPNAHGLERGTRGVDVVARLKPGVRIEAAQREIETIERRLADAYPSTNAGTSAEVLPLKEWAIDSRLTARLSIMLCAVAVVLLIACANVANLQLARGASRARELSVRAALGAGRGRIAQELLTESVLLSTMGGLGGVVLAIWMTKGVVSLLGGALPVDPVTIGIDAPVLAFGLAISIATGILFGLPPAWKASRTDLTDMLRSRTGDGLAHRATRNALVVAQLALSLALLTSAGLLTRSMLALERVDPGFQPDHLLMAALRLPPATYDSPDKIWAMFARAIAEVRAIPGVQSAALVRALPMSGDGETYPVTIAGHASANPADALSMQLNSISTQYFATMRIPILVGRDLADGDHAGTLPVIVVNQAFADHAWPGESALGKQVRTGDDQWRTVVAVVGNAHQYSLNEPLVLQGYIPYVQAPQVFTSIVVRTTGNPLDVASPLREAIWRVDRDQPVWGLTSMDEFMAIVTGASKTMMWLIGLLALAALIVAAVGVYGVLSYTMSQRTQEVGIRIALGADASRVTRMVVGEGVRLVGLAVAVGLLASVGTARLVRSQLFGVPEYDLTTFAVVTVVLSGVAILACYMPARRAGRVDPMVVLRSE